MVGRILNHYEVLERLGQGGTGEVYLAHDRKLDRHVALKVLPAEVAGDPGRRARFGREARAVAALAHPNIVTIHSVEEADDVHFLTMERVRGTTLTKLLGRPLPLERLLEIAIPLADAVGAAHARGIAHRDLEPDNVMLDEAGRLKVLDFGLAELLGPDRDDRLETGPTATATAEGRVLDTVPYMSPEQAEGKRVDARSDVFSLGILLHQMATGERPFRGDSSAAIVSSILRDVPPRMSDSIPDLPRQLGRIVSHCLEKDPARRFQTALDLRNELESLREELRAASSRPPAPPPAPPPEAAPAPPAPTKPRRGSAWPFLGALIVVALLAVAAVYALRRDEAPPAPVAEPVAGIGASGRPSIAVLTFETPADAEALRWLTTGVPTMLLTGLAQTPGLDVVSGQRIQQILDEVSHEDGATVDRAVMVEVARRSGAGAVVVGNIFHSDGELRIDVRVEDVASGRVLSADSVRGAEVFPLVDTLTARIRSSLAILAPPETRSITEIATGSLEAYRHYDEALQAVRNLRYADAQDGFRRALELDPSFAMAEFELAKLAYALGNDELAGEHLRRARERADQLPERQRMLVEAQYRMRVSGRIEEAAAILEDLIERYPDEEEAYRDLASMYGHLAETQKRRALVERGVRNLPRAGWLRNSYAYLLIRSGETDRALEQIRAYQELEPDEPNPLDTLGDFHLMTGQPEKALVAFDRVLARHPEFFTAHGGRAWAFAMLGRWAASAAAGEEIQSAARERGLPVEPGHFMAAHALSRVGRYEAARDRIAEGLTQETPRSPGLPAATSTAAGSYARVGLGALDALIVLERGRYADAAVRARDVREAAAEVVPDTVRGNMTVLLLMLGGAAEARAGNLPRAEELLADSQALYRPSVDTRTFWHHVLEGEVALARGDAGAALIAFRKGEPEHKMVFLRSNADMTVLANCLSLRDGAARALRAQGDFDGAAVEYRRLITPGGHPKFTSMLEPRHVLGLARVLAEAGDGPGAREQYERFLELWKDADPGQPEVAEARAYLASATPAPPPTSGPGSG